MQGIEFIQDENGKKIKLVIDLRVHGKFIEALFDELHDEPEQVEPEEIELADGRTDKLEAGLHSRQQRAQAAIASARSVVGTPYKTGGTGPTGFDCSGLMTVVFAAAGVKLPRVSRQQAKEGKAVGRTEVRPGDLLYFATGSPNRINHVALVSQVSDGYEVKFLHASSSRGVIESSLSSSYWSKAYRGARRVI